jgi:thiol-disulfide isomerase/thioredoxin
VDTLWRLAQGEQKSNVRQAALVNWLDAALAVHTVAPDQIRQALRDLPVSSPAWWLRPEAAFDAFTMTSNDDTSDNILALVDHLPDDTARARALLAYANAASATKRYAELHAVLERLNRDYSQTTQAKIANQQYGVKIVETGKPVRPFSFPSMETGQQYTQDTLKGKVYLIDFWATWCAPCIAEMENLHRAFSRFGPKGFTILSYSLDESPAIVKKFRVERWPMPWLHAWDGNVKDPQYALFGIFQIPATVLVGEDGAVIAFGDEVRGDNLLRLLERAYAK